MQLNSRNDAAYWPKVPGLSGYYDKRQRENSLRTSYQVKVSVLLYIW